MGLNEMKKLGIPGGIGPNLVHKIDTELWYEELAELAAQEHRKERLCMFHFIQAFCSRNGLEGMTFSEFCEKYDEIIEKQFELSALGYTVLETKLT